MLWRTICAVDGVGRKDEPDDWFLVAWSVRALALRRSKQNPIKEEFSQATDAQ